MPTNQIKVALAAELAKDAATLGIRFTPWPQPALLAGSDPLHPLLRLKQATSFASWDILNLWALPPIRNSALRATESLALKAAHGRSLGGLTELLTSCEDRVAELLCAEAALLFSSKNQLILTLITTLAAIGSRVVIAPAMSALPLADACALGDLELIECEGLSDYKGALERTHAKRSNPLCPPIVILESLSSITGKRCAVLGELLSLNDQSVSEAKNSATKGSEYPCWVVIDDSAALGHTGLRGAASAEAFPKAANLLARISSVTTICGSQIALLAAPRELREILLTRSRYLNTEPAPPPGDVAALLTGIDLLEGAIQKRQRLLALSEEVHTALKEQGWHVVSDAGSPICALWFDSYHKAQLVQEALANHRGIIVESLTARSLRKNGAVVRIILTLGHSELEIKALLQGLGEIFNRGY
jgi:7-keto-8-aminopelargonate synthetase-like enzyme